VTITSSELRYLRVTMGIWPFLERQYVLITAKNKQGIPYPGVIDFFQNTHNFLTERMTRTNPYSFHVGYVLYNVSGSSVFVDTHLTGSIRFFT